MDNLTPRTPDIESRLPLTEQGSNFDSEQKKIDQRESESQTETTDTKAAASPDKPASSSITPENIQPTSEAIRQQPDNKSGELPLELQPEALENMVNGHFDVDPFMVNDMLINKKESPSEQL